MMATKSVIFEEPIHHVCLMYGLRLTFVRMPFLNKRVLEVKGKVITIDNVVSPPPVMNYSGNRTSTRVPRNMIEVSYCRNKITVEYKEDMCSSEDITAFINNLIQDYLQFRHPFTKITIKNGRCHEHSSSHLIAEVI